MAMPRSRFGAEGKEDAVKALGNAIAKEAGGDGNVEGVIAMTWSVLRPKAKKMP